MDIEEAVRILDPTTTREALAEYEYFGGFRGEEAVQDAVNEACEVACAFIRKQLEVSSDELSKTVKDGA